MKTPARFSSLPVLQYCGQALVLSSQGGGNRATAKGTANHARSAKGAEYTELHARLSPSEQAELAELFLPTTTVCNGIELDYANATKEAPAQLRAPDGELVCEGTADMYWVVGDRLYLADIKNSLHTVNDGPRSLQIVGYAIAICTTLSLNGWTAGVFGATEGEWRWGDYHDAWSLEHEAEYTRAVASARNHGGEYNMGSHCQQCYARQRCPQYLLPPDMAETSLAPFVEPGAITNENATALLLLAQRAADTAKTVRGLLEDHARANGGIEDGAGKVWKPLPMRGRTSFDSKAFAKDNPGAIERYTKFGADYETFKWVNVPKGSK